MRVGNFSLLIPEGVERDSGHVNMVHGKQYTLRLGNNDHSRRADATVTVDGKVVGCFRLERGATWTIERPSHDTGRFTFYRSDSSEAATAGVAGISKDAMGLVEVVFRPERIYVPPVRPIGNIVRGMSCFPETTTRGDFGTVPMSFASAAPAAASPGMTGLSGVSDQHFTEVAALDYDPAGETTITVRLVGIDGGPRELTPAVPRANKIPEPV